MAQQSLSSSLPPFLLASSTPCLLTPQWHLISSNSPSGGMKLMLRSESNLLSRTHWWNVQSSMAIDCFPLRAGAEGLLVGTEEWQERVGWETIPPPKAAISWMRPALQTGKLPECSFLTQGSLVLIYGEWELYKLISGELCCLGPRDFRHNGRPSICIEESQPWGSNKGVYS